MLGAASQRIEFLLLEWFGNAWIQELLADWKRRERGSLPGIVETGLIFYICSTFYFIYFIYSNSNKK
jgi:transient receptor potential cation channel subfamily C